MNSIPDHASLGDLITEQEWWFAASEWHGMVSALIALNHTHAWPDMLFSGHAPEAAAFIAPACVALEATLADDDLRYALLLPEDGDSATRAQALVEWVQGFLLAVNYLKRHQPSLLDADGQGFIDDLQAISTLDTDIDDSEETASELTELEEHCRMGVLMLYATAHRAARSDKEHLH